MADDNDVVGTTLTAEGSEEFIRQINDSNKALEGLGEAIDKLGGKGNDVDQVGNKIKDLGDKGKKAEDDLGGTLKALEKMPIIGDSIGQVTSIIGGMGEAGEAAGAAISSGIGLAVVAVGAFIAVVAAAVAGLEALNNSVNQLVDYGNEVNDIVRVTGASADMAQQIDASAKIAGVNNQLVTMSFTQLNMAAAGAGESAAAALKKTGQGAVDTAAKVQQITDDFNAKQLDNQVALQQKLGDMAEAESQRTGDYEAKRLDMEVTHDAAIADARAALTQRLTDLAESHAQRVASLQSSLADEQASYDQQRADREQALTDSLAALSDTYEQKKDAVNQKYFAPKSAREQAAKQEELALLDKQQAEEAKKLTDKAAKDEQRLDAAHQKKQSKLEEQLAQEDAAYAKQTERLKQEEAKREGQLDASYEKQVASAVQAYDRQEAAAQKSHDRLLEQTQKQLEAETKARDNAIKTAEKQVAGAAGGTVAAASNVEKAFKKLGISLAEWEAMTPDQQITRMGKALEGIKDPVEKMNILADIFGRRRAAEMIEFFEVFSTPHPLGLKLTQEELDQLEQFKRDQREMDMQFELLGAQIGKVFFPIWQDLMKQLKEFWAEHGPAITKTIQDMAGWLKGAMVDGVRDAKGWWEQMQPALKTVWQILQDVWKAFTDVNDFMTKALKIGIGIIILAFDALLKALKPIDDALLKIHKSVIEFLQPAFQWFQANVLTPLGKTFDDVALTIGRFFANLSHQFDNMLATFPSWLKKLLGIEAFTPVVTINGGNTTGSGGYTPGYASGGVAKAGVPAMFGEDGPEMAIPAQDMYILPNSYSRAMGASATQILQNAANNISTTNNSMPVNIGITINGASYSAGQQAADAIITTLKARGISIAGVN